MAKKDQLRVLRAGTVINKTSSGQEREILTALHIALPVFGKEYGLATYWQKSLPLAQAIEDLQRKGYDGIDFAEVFDKSTMKPDGGILSIADSEGELYPILIAEVKNQGTNDLRLAEGKKKQAMGNAIERLGKNVIGFRTWFLPEDIFPFVCFGYGYDFHEASSIRDRIKTINMFGPLNTLSVVRKGPNNEFQRGSFFFRQERWAVEDMACVILDVMRQSTDYYQTKYAAKKFERL